jgi:hypothetical protein
MRVYGLRLDEIPDLDIDLFEQLVAELPRG